MIEFYQTSLKIHEFCAILLIVLVFIHFLLVNFRLNDAKYAIRIRNFLPLYYTNLAFMVLSGTNMLSVLHFKLSISAIFMIFGAIALIGIGIFEFKLLKKGIKIRNFDHFRKVTNRKILIDFCIIVFVGVI